MYLAQFFFPSVSSGSLLIYFSLMKTLIPLCWWWSLIFLSLIRSLMFSLHVTGFQNAFHSFSVVLLSPWRWNPPPSWRKPLSPLAEAKWQRGSRSFVYQYAPSAFCLQEELCVWVQYLFYWKVWHLSMLAYKAIYLIRCLRSIAWCYLFYWLTCRLVLTPGNISVI